MLQRWQYVRETSEWIVNRPLKVPDGSGRRLKLLTAGDPLPKIFSENQLRWLYMDGKIRPAEAKPKPAQPAEPKPFEYPDAAQLSKRPRGRPRHAA